MTASWEKGREKGSRGHNQGQHRKLEVLPADLPQLLTLGKVSTSLGCQEDMGGLRMRTLSSGVTAGFL